MLTRLYVCVQSALRLKPNFTDAYNNMASALVQKGLIPQAVECYNAALQINPSLVSIALSMLYMSCLCRRHVWLALACCLPLSIGWRWPHVCT